MLCSAACGILEHQLTVINLALKKAFKYGLFSAAIILFLSEANQNKNNSLVSNFYNKLRLCALFSVRNR